MTGGRQVVLCVGNEFRGDDAAGLAVAERLVGVVPAGVTVCAFEQEPSRLIPAWEGAESALIVDAVSSGAEPGTLHRFDASEEAVPQRVFRASTHAVGIGEAIEVARALGKLPRRVVVYGIEGREFEAGAGLSPAVAAAIDRATAAIVDDLTAGLGQTGR